MNKTELSADFWPESVVPQERANPRPRLAGHGLQASNADTERFVAASRTATTKLFSHSGNL